jgi:signal transduction histidine kinase
VAIGSSGAVTRVNGPARRILGAGDGPPLEGPNLGALLATFFARRHLSGIASLSFNNGLEEANQAPLTIVLSDERSEDEAHAQERIQRPTPVESSEHRLTDYIAHELKNPIGSIAALARVLRLRYETIPQGERAAALHAIETDAQRALLILEGLLNLAQGRSRPMGEAAPVPLHAILGRVVGAHRRRNPERTILLDGDSPVYACGDSMGLELALSNLLNNAEKYAPRSTQIEIGCYQEGSRATVLVVDHGIALPPERYQRLWDIYARGPDPDIAVSGSGIGLALCKELVMRMGGRVWAGPTQLGGSVFTVTLPTPGDQPPRRPEPDPAESLKSLPSVAREWNQAVA